MRTADVTVTNPVPDSRPAAAKFGWPLLAGLIVVAAGLRFAAIQAHSLWGDEIISLALASGHSWYPWLGEETELFHNADYYRERLTLAPDYFSERLLSLLRINDQVPLYYVLSNVWMHAFGTSEAGLRSLSLAANVGSIPILYALARQVASPRAAIYSVVFFALAPFQLTFALYNRPYALLGFFALLSTLAAVRLARRDAALKWLVIYAASAILGAYTHYLFVWNMVFHVPLVVFFRRRDRGFLLRFGAACAAISAASLAWAPIFLAQTRFSRDVGANTWFYWYGGSATVPGTILSLGHTTLKLLGPGEIDGFCGSSSGDPQCRTDAIASSVSYFIPMLLSCFVIVRLTQHLRRRFRERSSLRPDPWMLCVSWGACVFAGPVIMDALLNTHMVYSHRYFISASAPVYLAAAMALAGIPRPLLRRGAVAAFALFLLAGSELYRQGFAPALLYQVDARDVAAHIDDRGTVDDLVLVLDPGFMPQDFAYYLESNPDFARIDVPRWHPSAPDIATQLQRISRAKERPKIWYLDERGYERDARQQALEWLRTHFIEVEGTQYTNAAVFLFVPPEIADSIRGTDGRSVPTGQRK